MGPASLLFYAVGLCLFAEVANDRVSRTLDFLSVVGRAAKRDAKMANANEMATSSSHQMQITQVIASYGDGKMFKNNHFRGSVIDVCQKLMYQQRIDDLTLSEENRFRLLACSSCVYTEYFKSFVKYFENVDKALNFMQDFGHTILRVDIATGVVQSVCSDDTLPKFVHQHKHGDIFRNQFNFKCAVIQACRTLNEMNEYNTIMSINDNQARLAGCQCIRMLTNDFLDLNPPKDDDPLTILDLEVYDHLEMLGQWIRIGDEISLSEFYTSHNDVPKAVDEGRFEKVCKDDVMYSQKAQKNVLFPLTPNHEMRVVACKWLATQYNWSED